MLAKKIVRPKVQAIAGKGHIVERNDDGIAPEILLDRDDVFCLTNESLRSH
jgi:hypothetical protein